MPEMRRYKVIETREVEVNVGTDGSYEVEAVKRAQRIFMNPTPGFSYSETAPKVTSTIVERMS